MTEITRLAEYKHRKFKEEILKSATLEELEQCRRDLEWAYKHRKELAAMQKEIDKLGL